MCYDDDNDCNNHITLFTITISDNDNKIIVIITMITTKLIKTYE